MAVLRRRGRINEAENLYLRALSSDESNHKALSLLALLHHDKAQPSVSEVQCCAPPDRLLLYASVQSNCTLDVLY